MFRSKDNLVRVEHVTDMSNTVFLPASWSVINTPHHKDRSDLLFKNLYNTPATRHIILALNRNRKKEKTQALANLHEAQKFGWSFLDTVAIAYEKPITSNTAFSSLCEVGYILYKGEAPDIKNTKWFSENGNAGNLWNVAGQPEEPIKLSSYQKFNWETQLLMLSLSKPIEYSRFIYGLPTSEIELNSIYQFVSLYQVSVLLYVSSVSEAELIISGYHRFLKEKESK